MAGIDADETLEPPTPAAARRGARLSSTLLLHGLLLLLWLACFHAAWLLEYAPHASLWFPPAAITLAGFAVLGLRAWPVLLLACGVATFGTNAHYQIGLGLGELVWASLAFAAAHTGTYGLAALAMRRLAQGATGASTMLRAVTVLLLGGAVATALAALTGAGALVLTGMLPAADMPSLLVPWMIGDYAGLIALAPLAILLLRLAAERLGLDVHHGLPRMEDLPAPDPEQSAFYPKLALLLGLSGGVLALASALPEQPAVVFALFPAVVIQLWIVHSESAPRALVGIAAFSLLLAAGTAWLGLQQHALALQFAMISLAANSYFGLAVPELYADNARLRHLLTHDVLTGALSRAFFEERARDGLEHAQRRGARSTLVMADLDLLKQINDSRGHAAGDAALRAFVARGRACLRPGDLFGRLSGDEFGVFLPDTGIDEARAIAARMRDALAKPAGPDDRVPPLSASFGIAEPLGPDERYEALLARADAAMYRVKRAERAA